ncbi:hypothetical protein AB4Y42_44780, partial [Paraburkholderia sp. EG286B]|uniref:hypothetical protein n=1 Tax=Paraburkholderia sp. EG286B TaxID=3237011 RepID=UPI0034D17DEA
RVFAIGRPIVSTTASPLGMQIQVEYVVVSEGAYRLHIFSMRLLPKAFSLRLAVSRSPARLMMLAEAGTAFLS